MKLGNAFELGGEQMSQQSLIALFGILIGIIFISYGVYIRAYSQGFKDGLKWSLYNSVFTKNKAEKERGE